MISSSLNKDVCPEFLYYYSHVLNWNHPIPISLARVGIQGQYDAVQKELGPEGKDWMATRSGERRITFYAETQDVMQQITLRCDIEAEAAMRTDLARPRPEFVTMDNGMSSIAIPISQEDIDAGRRPELNLDGFTDRQKERVAALMDRVFAPGGFQQIPAPDHLVEEIGRKAFGHLKKHKKARRRV